MMITTGTVISKHFVKIFFSLVIQSDQSRIIFLSTHCLQNAILLYMIRVDFKKWFIMENRFPSLICKIDRETCIKRNHHSSTYIQEN